MILFLDFDGVLHPSIKGEPDFCRLELLWNILRACPDVEVVFSTSWRELYPVQALIAFVTQGGGEDLAPRFLGTTPNFLIEPGKSYLGTRHIECCTWLEGNNQQERPWLAVDDYKYVFPSDSPTLYLTDGKTGLTVADAEKIIEKLKQGIIR